MTKNEALKCLAILKASYPRQEIGRDTFEAYATMLADVDFADAQAAAQRIICSSKWFPTIAEIRAETAKATTANLPAVELAWGEVWKAISKYGMHRTPVFSCPEIATAVDAVGWRQICIDENVTATRANFREAYRAVRERQIEAKQLGVHDIKRDQLPAQSFGLRLVSGDKP